MRLTISVRQFIKGINDKSAAHVEVRLDVMSFEDPLSMRGN